MNNTNSQLKNHFKPRIMEAGCDEAGRGCLAGPVCAAAVILPRSFYHPLLTDSKKLTDKQRRILKSFIVEESIAWAVASVDHQEIDEINILNASILAMHKALDQLDPRPEHILVDGHRFHIYQKIPHECIVKGDGKYASIAAASVLAKTFRDDFMIELHQNSPFYHWHKNKGYPTRDHRLAIEKYGISEYHRRSYKLRDPQQKIPFSE